jgi:hypothetical protein
MTERQMIERLRKEAEASSMLLFDRAANMLELVVRERDEARRQVCALDADMMEDQIEYARWRGWDCFEGQA